MPVVKLREHYTDPIGKMMENKKIEALIPQIAELAKEANTQDPVDWGMLAINEDQAFAMMASNVVEQVSSIPAEQREIVMMATMTKLLVENFVLNLRLKGVENAKNQV